MRNTMISALLSVLISVPALAGGGHHGIQDRYGHVDGLIKFCDDATSQAHVHKNGARFTVKAWGCTPGDVMTLWAFVGDEPEKQIILNCGGGVVLPDGRFKTICDVPRAKIEPCDYCAQILTPSGELRDPRKVSFTIEMLTHNKLVPEIALLQIRTVSTCSVDQCAPVVVFDFPVPSHHRYHHKYHRHSHH